MGRVLERPPPGTIKAFFYALLLHGVLLGVLAVSLDWRWVGGSPAPEGKAVRARVVPPEALTRVREAREAEARRREAARRAAAARREREAARRRAELLEKRRARQRAEAARRKALEEKRLAQRRARREAARRKREAARERALKERLAAEEAERALARRAASVLDGFRALIAQHVARNWIRPPGARPGLKAEFLVYATPGGEVTRVQLLRSSGDPAFDRSAENALYKATPLPFPGDPEVARYLSRQGFRFEFKPEPQTR